MEFHDIVKRGRVDFYSPVPFPSSPLQIERMAPVSLTVGIRSVFSGGWLGGVLSCAGLFPPSLSVGVSCLLWAGLSRWWRVGRFLLVSSQGRLRVVWVGVPDFFLHLLSRQ